MKKLEGESLNFIEQNLNKLKEIFPSIVVEDGTIGFEKLKLILGGNINTNKEFYGLNWNGKVQAVTESRIQSKATLRPLVDKSLEFHQASNLYIEGENLEVLKLLQKSYNSEIDLIYIDPPYNTGRDFIYNDTFKDNVSDYFRKTKQVNEDGKLLTANVESSGSLHSNWLSMMYSRLKLAHSLLSNKGFIAVSIADEEAAQLKLILDEIFGEANFRNKLLVRRYDKNINLQFVDKGLKSLNVGSEYIYVYSKNPSAMMNAVYRENSLERSKEGYWKGFWNDADRPTMRYDLLGYIPTEGQWKWKKEVAEEAVQNYLEYEKNYAKQMTIEEYWEMTGKEKKFIRRRPHLTGKNGGVEHWVKPSEGILRSSNWNDLLVSESINYLDLKFDSPKNPAVIIEILKMLCNKNSLILDFFSGSATTAHATMQLNAEDGGNRKFIMVQLPEPLDEKSEAYKDGYRTICDIGEERIRRAGEKIKSELIEKQQNSGMLDENIVDPESIDIGFKVLKLDTSNIREWNVDFADLENKLDLYDTPFIEGRSDLDVVYEIMLKQGLELTYSIETFEINGQTVYDIGFGSLFICLSQKITKDIAYAIIARRDEQETDTSSVIFSDAGFTTDSDKLNCIEILKDAGYSEDNLLTL